jgi:SET domain-containing protein
MIKEKNMYKPLPDSLTIKQSKVNGLGLFAKQGIAQGTNLGTTHIKVGEAIIRTPLGGFINHANEANCVKVELHDEVYKKKWNLITLKNIKEGEELTLHYTFYNV